MKVEWNDVKDVRYDDLTEIEKEYVLEYIGTSTVRKKVKFWIANGGEIERRIEKSGYSYTKSVPPIEWMDFKQEGIMAALQLNNDLPGVTVGDMYTTAIRAIDRLHYHQKNTDDRTARTAIYTAVDENGVEETLIMDVNDGISEYLQGSEVKWVFGGFREFVKSFNLDKKKGRNLYRTLFWLMYGIRKNKHDLHGYIAHKLKVDRSTVTKRLSRYKDYYQKFLWEQENPKLYPTTEDIQRYVDNIDNNDNVLYKLQKSTLSCEIDFYEHINKNAVVYTDVEKNV